MNPKRSEIQAYARSLIGTPYQHQGRVPGVGLDCSGLVVAVANHFGIGVSDYTGYNNRPDGMLAKRVGESFIRVRCDRCAPQVGDVLCFVGKRYPQHLAIRTDVGMVHALADSLVVNETSLDERWTSRLLCVFEWPVALESDTLVLLEPRVASVGGDEMPLRPRLQTKRQRCRDCKET